MSKLFFDLSAVEHDVISKVETIFGCRLHGRFGLKDVASWYHILELADDDKKCVRKVRLTRGEFIFRCVTPNSFSGGFIPLVKINFERRLVYFLIDSAFTGGEIEFEARGNKAAWILVDDNRQASA